MRRLKVGAAIAMAFLVCACISPTPFQPADKEGENGYTVQRVSQDHFHIAFSGNSATTRRQVEESLAYLAAQVTLRNNADYFRVMNDRTSEGSVYDTLGYPLPAYPEGAVPCCFVFRGMTSHDYAASADIVIFKGAAPPNDPSARDARSVADEIGPQIKRSSRFSIY